MVYSGSLTKYLDSVTVFAWDVTGVTGSRKTISVWRCWRRGTHVRLCYWTKITCLIPFPLSAVKVLIQYNVSWGRVYCRYHISYYIPQISEGSTETSSFVDLAFRVHCFSNLDVGSFVGCCSDPRVRMSVFLYWRRLSDLFEPSHKKCSVQSSTITSGRLWSHIGKLSGPSPESIRYGSKDRVSFILYYLHSKIWWFEHH